MTKNAKIIIFSLIGLLILGGVAAILMFTAPQKEAPVQNDEFASPKTASDDADLMLCSRDTSDITSIDVHNDVGSYSITPSGNTDSEGEVIWTIADISSAPLNADSLSTAAKYACSFDAKEFAEKVSDSSELAKYGLDKPRASVATTFKDGSTFEIRVGNEVPNAASSVYVTPDGESIYTAYKSRINSFLGNKYSFVDLVVMPEYDQNTGEEVMKMTVERTTAEKILEPLVIENILSDDPDAINVYSYRMVSPYSAYLDLSDGPAFVYSLFGLNATNVCSTGEQAEADYAALGFDNPVCKVTIETNVRTYTLTLGSSLYEKETGEDGTERNVLKGYYGVSSERPGVIYFFDRASVSILNIDETTLISELFLMPYIYDLESVSYSDNAGHKLDMGIKLIQKAEENKEEVSEFTVNGEKWDGSKFKNLYQYLISAAGEELYLDSDKGELIAEIVYGYTDKSNGVDGRDTVRFYSSNTDRKVIIELNGENIFKTRQMYATQLISNIDSFLSGGEITLTY
jgi:hypothetical protein